VFSERIQRRALVWWGKPNKWRRAATYRHLLHTFKENNTLRDRNDPDRRWRCCALWQRTLSNKWNSREFAARHGCRVPALYWSGRRIGTLPIRSLPEHFVIRPIWGDSHRNVRVIADDTDLFTGKRYPRDHLAHQLRRTIGRIVRFPIMVEEFVRTESGAYELPIDYKCHMFGDVVGAIEVVHRPHYPGKAAHRCYSASWEPFDDCFNTTLPQSGVCDPPKCLDEILAYARRLGAAYGTYVRVDCYASDRGCVFGEFSSTPTAGRNFTPYADEYFEALWRETFPERT